MTTPTGAISLLDIQTEFGGANPISLNEYFRNASAYVSNNQATGPNGAIGSDAGSINMNTFRGITKYSGGSIGFGTVGTTAWVVPGNIGIATYMRSIGGGGGGGGGSSRAGRQSAQEYVGGGGGGGNATVYQSTIYGLTPGSTIYIVVGGGGGGGGGRDGTYSAGSNGGAGSHSGVLNTAQSVWHSLSYGGGGGTVGQDNAQAARGVRGADRATGVGSVYNYGWNSGYGTVGKNDFIAAGKGYSVNANGGQGAQGYNIWGDSSGSVGEGGSFNDGTVVGDRGYANAVTGDSYGAGGGGGAGANRWSGSYINGAAGNQGGVVIWW